jgi:hypothetical protein
VNSFSTVEYAVVLPRVDIGRSARLRNVVIDAEVKIPEGLVVGEDPELDAKRFRRTESGICLITQPMIDRLLAQPTVHRVPEHVPVIPELLAIPEEVPTIPESSEHVLPPLRQTPKQAAPSIDGAEVEDHTINGLDHDATIDEREGEAATGGLEA